MNDSLRIWYWLHLSNWRSAFGHDVPILTHFWSLSIEEQFYLIWPVVVFLVSRRKLACLCCTLIVFSLLLRLGCRDYAGSFPTLLDRLTPFRIDTLAFGALLAVIVRDGRWLAAIAPRIKWAALAAVLGLGIVLARAATSVTSNPLIATYGFSLLAVLYSCLVLGAYVQAGSSRRWSKLLRSRALRSFGKYSYAIYVIHFPISYYFNFLLPSLAARVPSRYQVGVWALAKAGGIGLSYLGAMVSWHCLEKHVLALKDFFRPRFSDTEPIRQMEHRVLQAAGQSSQPVADSR